MSPLELIEEHRCFGGLQRRFRHSSPSLQCSMTLGLFLPPVALAAAGQGPARPVPALWWLSGLTCNDENAVQKSGAQRLAAELGLAIVTPDTSPRGAAVPDDSGGAWDFGHGAGFYVDASEEPWARHYRMHTYITGELPALLEAVLPLDPARRGISGHSMGGHGALVCALRHPGMYRSVSAFAPIAHPSACPWGRKALGLYLGTEPERWSAWDACRLLRAGQRLQGPGGHTLPLLVDQGEADPFLCEQLRPDELEAACGSAGQPLHLRRQPGYDHSYFFVASFIDDHLRHHAAALLEAAP